MATSKEIRRQLTANMANDALKVFENFLCDFDNDVEFEVSDVFGYTIWSLYSSFMRNQIGREVRKKSHELGIKFVKLTPGNHRVYKKLPKF